MTAFCSCPKSLSETKVKSFGLIPLAEEVLIQSSIDSVVLLLVATLIQIYNKKEQAEKVKIQNIQCEEKWSTRKWNGAKSCI